MAIPTKEQFQELLKRLSTFHNKELAKKVAEDVPTSEPELVKILKNADESLSGQWPSINNCHAVKWFESQPAGTNVLKKLSRSMSSRSPKESPELLRKRLAQNFLAAFNDTTCEELEKSCRESTFLASRLTTREAIREHVDYSNRYDVKERHFLRRVMDYLNREPAAWYRGLFQALHDYYHTDRWERLYVEFGTKKNALHAARGAVAALHDLSSHLIEPVTVHVSRRAIESIEMQLAADVLTLYPIRRKDTTCPERVLVYDLYQNNKKNKGGSSTNLIYSMMMLEGIRHPLDARTVERLVAKWDASVRDYRRKRSAFAEKTAGY